MISKNKCVLISIIASILTGLTCIFITYSLLNGDNTESDIYYGTYEIGGSASDIEYLAIIPPLKGENTNEGQYYSYNSANTNIESGSYKIDENNCLHLYNDGAIVKIIYYKEKYIYIQDSKDALVIVKNSDEAIIP